MKFIRLLHEFYIKRLSFIVKIIEESLEMNMHKFAFKVLKYSPIVG